jgi:uncharacterized protein
MPLLTIQRDTQRISEVVVTGPSITLQKRLITHLCNEVILTSNNTVFGRSRITDELQLFFYGIGEKEQYQEFAWDIVGRKMLGYIVVFNWYDSKSFQETQLLVDHLSRRINGHGIIVGDVADSYLAIDPRVYEHGFSLTSKLYFTLWDSSAKAGARNAVRILIDTVINHLD